MKVTELSLRIILIFVTAILASFIPDNFPSFFGDWHCVTGSGLYIYKGSTNIEGHFQYCSLYGSHLPTWHFGYRHYLWCIMGIVLFIIQIVYLINKNDK